MNDLNKATVRAIAIFGIPIVAITLLIYFGAV